MVTNWRILVAEDEVFIALDLSFAVEDSGCQVVRPVANVRDALRLIDETVVAGAILDVNLLDGDISPVVERLIEIGTPFILQTGLGLPPDLAARFPFLQVHSKPCDAATLIEQLLAMIESRRLDTEDWRRPNPPGSAFPDASTGS